MYLPAYLKLISLSLYTLIGCRYTVAATCPVYRPKLYLLWGLSVPICSVLLWIIEERTALTQVLNLSSLPKLFRKSQPFILYYPMLRQWGNKRMIELVGKNAGQNIQNGIITIPLNSGYCTLEGQLFGMEEQLLLISIIKEIQSPFYPTDWSDKRLMI